MRKFFNSSFLWLWLIVLTLIPNFLFGQSGINENGGFEGNLPSYWTMGNNPGENSLSWATDEYRSMGHSLKIEKTAVGDSASWISENMTDLWSPQNYKDVDIKIGGYVKTMNVNTNPANDDERWWISYSFYDSAGALIGETKMPIDQSTASSSGWVADTNGIGETILPKDSWKTIIKFVAGKNATGTVWADDFMLIGRNGAWAGQDWNTQVGMPTGWNYWLPPVGGNDGELSNGFENTVVTTEAAYTGTHSLKLVLPFDREPHDGWIGTRRAPLNSIDQNIKAGDVLRVSVWIKASDLVPDSAAKYPGTWSVGVTPIFHSGYMNNSSYDEIGAQDLVFQFPNVTSFGWTKYYADVTVPDDANAKAFSARLHIYSRFTGTIYFDELNVEKLDIPQISGVGSFEGNLPSYWTMGNNPGENSLSWATDEYRSMGHSLKIEKTAVGDSASWISENMTDLWSPQNYKDVDIKIGGYVKTMNVNTNPANDDERWWISYSFYDSAGALIGETKMPIDQSTASSSGWVADTNGIGETILPKDSWKTIIKFVAGKNATGTVWADDFMLIGRNGAWAGQDWNTQVGMPTGWNYWLPPVGGNDGELSNGFENTVVTTEAAYTGTHSLKLVLPFDREPHDGWIGTRRAPLNSIDQNIKAGDVLRVSVWIKASDLVPDSAAKYPGTWSVGVTPIFHSGYMNNSSYDEIGAQDLVFQFPNVTSFGWTKYYADVTVPDDANAKAFSARLHIYSRFTGTIYFDELNVEKLDIPQISGVGSFEGNLPSYWTMGNNPGENSLSWATDEYRSMGHSLKIEKTAVGDSASWISENMTDLWSPQNYKDVDIKIGGYVKTMNVNTNPANDDERWWISYSFYDSAGALIGETKMPIDQSTASSSGWVADTNGIGETILPKDSWKTIIKFVAGKNATGTVWADDFMLIGRNGAWAGQDWNTQVGMPTGWNYWLPPVGGNDGELSNGFENTVVTTEAAYTGTHSLKLVLPFDREPHDAWVGTRRYPLNNPAIMSPNSVNNNHDISNLTNIGAGDVIRISVWIKASDLVPDSAAKYPGTWSVGVTPIFHSGYMNNSPYDEIGGQDLVFQFPNVTSFDWTKYYVDITVPDDQNAIALSARIHIYSRFTGTVYFDNLEVQKVGSTTDVADGKIIPSKFEVFQNYPNPFNPSTTISYALPQNSFVTLKVYDILGREVKTLVNSEQVPGIHNMIWNGENNYGSKVSSGIYIYRVVAGNYIQTKKMILMK